MRILLPPSEAKRPAGTGRPIGRRTKPGALAALAAPRAQAIAALHRIISADEAARVLLLPPSVIEETMAANARVLTARTLPAIERYAGIVYDGLSIDTLSARARKLADHSVLIFSGLFGLSRGADPLPAYRVPAKATLPGLGIATTFWKSHLLEAVPALLDRGPIIDLRSTDYAAMWMPHTSERLASRMINVRVLSIRPDGSRGVVSYSSKLGKGKLAAALLERHAAGDPVTSANDVAEAWLKGGGHAAEPREAKAGCGLDLLD